MKIQCDVCSRDEASVFCCADEAALCDACDRKVHHANKLAGKHNRISLSTSQNNTLPLCDICKEKTGCVFCQEDRAILCWDCDEPIHAANPLTMKHSRFLLTGARISATPLSEINHDSNKLTKASQEKNNQNKPKNFEEVPSVINTSNGSSDSSSISEYLMKTLPGYRVEDLLDFEGSYKNDELLPFSEPEIAIADKSFPVWIPHVPQIQFSTYPSNDINCFINYNHKDLKQNQHNRGSLRENRTDDSFMVPQINTRVLSNNKRCRPSSVWEF